MKTLAAVLVAHCKPLELVDLEIPPLQPGQCLVEIAYSGVCGTQIGEWKGTRGPDAYLPHCLGHEASGFVREANGVRKVKPGDAVICSWMKGSGADVPGMKYKQTSGGSFRTHCFSTEVNAGGITTFQRFAVISENRLTPLPDDWDMTKMREAALLGCPVPTGIGSVWNTAGARPGQSVAVFGCGGVGLSAILGAKLAGCWPIIAVDVSAMRLKSCRPIGVQQERLIVSDKEIVRTRDGEQFDIAVECSGSPRAMEAAMECVKPRGGICVIVGNAKHGETLTINPRWLNDGKQLRGSWGGDNAPDLSFPVYARLMQAGKLDVGPLIGETFPLEEINDALRAMESGCAGRPIISMGDVKQ